MANLQPKKEHVDVVIIGCGAGGGVSCKGVGGGRPFRRRAGGRETVQSHNRLPNR